MLRHAIQAALPSQANYQHQQRQNKYGSKDNSTYTTINYYSYLDKLHQLATQSK